MYPEELRYTLSHQWLRAEDRIVTIGLTDYLTSRLGYVRAVEFEPVGKRLKKKESFGKMETAKVVWDLESPLSGIIQEVNKTLLAKPRTINNDPYGSGWLIKMKIRSLRQLDKLSSVKRYEKFAKR